MEVMRRLCWPGPLAARKSPKVVGVAGYGTSPVGLQGEERRSESKEGLRGKSKRHAVEEEETQTTRARERWNGEN